MPKYRITVELAGTLTQTFEIEADNQGDAEDLWWDDDKTELKPVTEVFRAHDTNYVDYEEIKKCVKEKS